MIIVVEKEYPFGTLSAWYDDPEKGWQSDNATFLLLWKTTVRSTPTKWSYNPNPVHASAVATCERINARIVKYEPDTDDLPPGTIY